MEAVVVVPMSPPVEVSPNWRGNWRTRARAVRAFREAAGWAAKAWLTEHTSQGDVRASQSDIPREKVFCILDAEIRWEKGRNAVDPTNAPILLKALVDGLADVLWEGGDGHVVFGEVTQCRGDGSVLVTLRGG